MKKTIFVLTILALLSALVACNKTTTAQTQNGLGGNSAPLSTATELLVGTFKLEGTDLAVTSAQAKQLLPLWQTLQALSTSITAADQEINAVVDQIKSTMTSQQMTRITAMKLTQQDIMSVMSQTGVSPNGASATTTPMTLNGFPGGNNSQGGGGAARAGGPPGGGGPGGGFPAGGGGGGMPSGGGIDPGAMGGPNGASTTPQAVRQMPNQVPAPLLNALIELLQKKIK
jgi:NACalpha-BTF3-like transcription factor